MLNMSRRRYTHDWQQLRLTRGGHPSIAVDGSITGVTSNRMPDRGQTAGQPGRSKQRPVPGGSWAFWTTRTTRHHQAVNCRSDQSIGARRRLCRNAEWSVYADLAADTGSSPVHASHECLWAFEAPGTYGDEIRRQQRLRSKRYALRYR